MGDGVARAIRETGGQDFFEESRSILNDEYTNGLPTGQSLLSPSGEMDNCDYVIHTVDPRYGKDKPEDELLKKSYMNSLELARDGGFESITFPSISTGIFGYPIDEAVQIVKNTLGEWEYSFPKKVKLILHSEEDYNIYRKKFE